MARECRDFVFISHASEDAAAVAALCLQLRIAGIETFSAADIQPSSRWVQELDHAIVECRAGLAILSQHTGEGWPVGEQERLVNRAFSERGFTLAVGLLDERNRCKGSGFLFQFQTSDLLNPTEIQRLIEVLRPLHAPAATSAGSPSSQRPGVTVTILRSLRRAAQPLTWLTGVLLVLGLIPATLQIRPLIRRAELRQVQQNAQAIDERVERLLKAGELSRVVDNGETPYRVNGAVVAADVFENNALVRRNLYERGRVIAFDEYRYRGRQIVAKLRNHLDQNQTVYLREEFDETGLRVKQYCPEGRLSDCVPYTETGAFVVPGFSILPGFRY